MINALRRWLTSLTQHLATVPGLGDRSWMCLYLEIPSEARLPSDLWPQPCLRWAISRHYSPAIVWLCATMDSRPKPKPSATTHNPPTGRLYQWNASMGSTGTHTLAHSCPTKYSRVFVCHGRAVDWLHEKGARLSDLSFTHYPSFPAFPTRQATFPAASHYLRRCLYRFAFISHRTVFGCVCFRFRTTHIYGLFGVRRSSCTK